MPTGIVSYLEKNKNEFMPFYAEIL